MIKVTKALTMKHRKKREVITSFRKKSFSLKVTHIHFLILKVWAGLLQPKVTFSILRLFAQCSLDVPLFGQS